MLIPALIRLVSWARCSATTCMAGTAWCNASNSSGADFCNARDASISAEMVVLSGVCCHDRVELVDDPVHLRAGRQQRGTAVLSCLVEGSQDPDRFVVAGFLAVAR